MSLPYPEKMRAGLDHLIENFHTHPKQKAMLICVLDYFLREAKNLCLIYLYVKKSAEIDEHDQQSGISAWSKINADDIKKTFPACVKYHVLHGVGSGLEHILDNIVYSQNEGTDNMYAHIYETKKYKGMLDDFPSVYAQLIVGQSVSSVCEWLTTKETEHKCDDDDEYDTDDVSSTEDDDYIENVFCKLDVIDEEWKKFVPTTKLQRVIYNCVNTIS